MRNLRTAGTRYLHMRPAQGGCGRAAPERHKYGLCEHVVECCRAGVRGLRGAGPCRGGLPTLAGRVLIRPLVLLDLPDWFYVLSFTISFWLSHRMWIVYDVANTGHVHHLLAPSFRLAYLIISTFGFCSLSSNIYPIPRACSKCISILHLSLYANPASSFVQIQRGRHKLQFFYNTSSHWGITRLHLYMCAAMFSYSASRQKQGALKERARMDMSGIEPDPSRKQTRYEMLSERDNQLHHMPNKCIVISIVYSFSSSGVPCLITTP